LALLGTGWSLLLICWLYRALLGWKLPYLVYILYSPGLCFWPIGFALACLHLAGGGRRERVLALLAMIIALGPLAGWRWNFVKSDAELPVLRVATANLHSYQNDLPAASKVLADLDLDVILLQEVWNQSQLDQVRRGLPGYRFVRGGGFVSTDYFEFGTFIATRADLVEGSVASLERSVVCKVQWKGRPVSVVCLHGPKISDRNFKGFAFGPKELLITSGLQQAQAQKVTRALQPGPAIVGGDFNAPESGPGPHLLETRLNDSFHQGGRGYGCTFPSRFPVFRMDLILSSPEFTAVSSKTFGMGSDHLGVVSEFQWVDP
jgi:endonuclease/exonuclease/phosphatase family metal-dependent hydrolase